MTGSKGTPKKKIGNRIFRTGFLPFVLTVILVLYPLTGRTGETRVATHQDVQTDMWGVIQLEGNDAIAQYKLGIAYRFGDGVSVDLEEAVRWFRLSAEQGHPKAQYELGLAYNEGYSVAIDNDVATKWFLRSARQGDVGAQNSMGIRYVFGKKAKKDRAEGVKWGLVSKRAGFLGAYVFLPFAWLFSSSEEWAAGTELADQWVPVLEDPRYPFN